MPVAIEGGKLYRQNERHMQRANAFSFCSDIQQFGNIREVDKQIIIDFDFVNGIKSIPCINGNCELAWGDAGV